MFLDAECAWFGDPAFDLAFCLNHLLLKGARDGAHRARYGAAFSALAGAYLAEVAWESADGLEARAAALLPALFLARILTANRLSNTSPWKVSGASVRRVAATRLIVDPPCRLAVIAGVWTGSS